MAKLAITGLDKDGYVIKAGRGMESGLLFQVAVRVGGVKSGISASAEDGLAGYMAY